MEPDGAQRDTHRNGDDLLQELLTGLLWGVLPMRLRARIAEEEEAGVAG